MTACYEPFAFSSQQRLYCPFFSKATGDYLQVEDSYDYTVVGKGTAWYTGPRDKGAQWAEPYYANAAKDWYLDYGVPFYYAGRENKGKVRGTITMSFVASGFKDIVQSLSLGKTGFGLIASTEGKLLSHPHGSFIGVRDLEFVASIDEYAAAAGGYKAMECSEKGDFRYFDPWQNDKALFYYTVIPTTGWSLGLVILKATCRAISRR